MEIQGLLDAARIVAEIPSDNQLAKRLKVSQGAVWKWRQGRDLPKPEYAAALAELAGLNPETVVAEVLEMGANDMKLKEIYGKIKRAILAAATTLPALLMAAHQCILC